jgi:hypothetical protein
LAAPKCATGVEYLNKKTSVAARRLPETLPGLLCSIQAKRGLLLMMNVLSLADSFAQHIRTFQLDDSSVALIALLAGMIGGYRLTGWHEQLKARRAKIAQRPRGTQQRKSD